MARNQVRHQLGVMKIESWVGRNARKWLPGLYWLNLISAEMAMHHGIPLDSLAAASRQYRDLGNGQYLFRLYDHPEDWKDSAVYQQFLKDIPALFDINAVKRRLPEARNFLELQNELWQWQSGTFLEQVAGT